MALNKELAWSGLSKLTHKRVRGYSPESNQAALRSRLREDYYRIRIRPVNALFARLSKTIQGAPRASSIQRTDFFRELTINLSAEMPLERAIRQSAVLFKRKSGMHAAAVEVADAIAGNVPIHEAFARHPAVFGKQLPEVLNVGADTDLKACLLAFAEAEASSQKVRRDMRALLKTPIFFTAGMIIMLGYAVFAVLPALSTSLASVGNELPTSTKNVLALRSFILASPTRTFFILFALVSGMVLTFFWIKARRVFWERVLLRTPVLGHMLRLQAHARMCAMMSVFISVRLPPQAILEHVSKHASFHLYVNAMRKAAEEVAEDGNAEAALARQTPPLMIQMPSMLGNVLRGVENAEAVVSEFAKRLYEEVEVRRPRTKQAVTLMSMAVLAPPSSYFVWALTEPTISSLQFGG